MVRVRKSALATEVGTHLAAEIACDQSFRDLMPVLSTGIRARFGRRCRQGRGGGQGVRMCTAPCD